MLIESGSCVRVDKGALKYDLKIIKPERKDVSGPLYGRCPDTSAVSQLLNAIDAYRPSDNTF